MAIDSKRNCFVCDECGGVFPPDPSMLVRTSLVREPDERDGVGMVVLEERDLTDLALSTDEELAARNLTVEAREAILRGDPVIPDLPACLCHLCQDMMADFQFRPGEILQPFPTGLAPIAPLSRPFQLPAKYQALLPPSSQNPGSA